MDALLCCGIRQCDYYSSVNAGIDIYQGLMGETEEVLEAFLRGKVIKEDACGATRHTSVSSDPRRAVSRRRGCLWER